MGYNDKLLSSMGAGYSFIMLGVDNVLKK